MRVTNSIITNNSKLRLQTGLQGIDRLRDDIATGVTIRKISDNVISGGEIVRIGSSMRALTQFKRNADSAAARAEAEEGVLNQLTNTITRASELSVTQAGSTATAQSRLAVKAEVDQLLNFAVGLGNTRFGDEYLLGGTRANEPPLHNPAPATGTFSRLMLAGNPVDPSGNITLEVGDNKFVTPTHNAKEVLLDTDALEALRELSTALGNNDTAAIQAATTRLNTANSNVQSLIGTQGARINEIEDAKVNLQAMEMNLKMYRSDLRDTEVDQAMVELVGKQTLYQAAMSATSRILGLSLANYL
ncbi:MAG TPA: flagellin [Gemmatimonas sp.]|uniref:flagellin N-terminal helical domain-containing protein n=1 Tax=Gemmatimonas sp. TaxID=1962908 RepID=UPI002ED8C592